MSKQLVVCCDGTWNIPDQRSPTNVTKVALALAPTDRSGHEQRTYYHRGVGTSRWERIRGGAFGFGLSRDVCAAYRFLVQNYDPGDKVYFFGFSRGAYTARSTAGFVRTCGVLRRENLGRVNEAYELYRSRSSTTHPCGVEATLFRRSYSHETRIRFIGVWDTVGALGIPMNGLRMANLINRRWAFHDTQLSHTVDAAFQALAIDEKRGPFRPTLWIPPDKPPKDQQVEQVWFAGVHSDVGGGYPEHETSDIPLLWMVDRARSCGLEFHVDAFTRRALSEAPTSAGDDVVRQRTAVHPDPLGDIHESRKGVYRMIPPFVRSLGGTDEAHEHVASSALKRHEEDSRYAPPGLVGYLDGEHRIMQIASEPLPPHDRPSALPGASREQRH